MKKQEQMKRKLMDNFEKEKTFLNMLATENYEAHKEQRIVIPKGRLLAIIVGQSGIGKSTEICQYAKTLRENNLPVRCVDMSKDPDNAFDFNEFLQETFGTADKSSIIKIISENYTEKHVVPTLIIDNVHRCLDSKGRIHQKLLDFLNSTCFQKLMMSVIMLSSDNTAAYEIEENMNTLKFMLLVIHSLYRFRIFWKVENP